MKYRFFFGPCFRICFGVFCFLFVFSYKFDVKAYFSGEFTMPEVTADASGTSGVNTSANFSFTLPGDSELFQGMKEGVSYTLTFNFKALIYGPSDQSPSGDYCKQNGSGTDLTYYASSIFLFNIDGKAYLFTRNQENSFDMVYHSSGVEFSGSYQWAINGSGMTGGSFHWCGAFVLSDVSVKAGDSGGGGSSTGGVIDVPTDKELYPFQDLPGTSSTPTGIGGSKTESYSHSFGEQSSASIAPYLKIGHSYKWTFYFVLNKSIYSQSGPSPSGASVNITNSTFNLGGVTHRLSVGVNTFIFTYNGGDAVIDMSYDSFVPGTGSFGSVNSTYWRMLFHIENIELRDMYGLSVEQAVNELVVGQEEQIQQQEQFHEEERSSAEQAGDDMGGFASQLENLKGAWEILWYPIEFTNTVMSVFSDGTGAAEYANIYNNISGYTYDDSTGLLKPVYKNPVATISGAAPVAVDVPSGTGLTFPSFSIMGVTVWDAYTFDLAGLKDKFPVVFDSLYVIVSILEVFWFVGFLREKYEEVFG